MSRLRSEHARFIVVCLARFMSPSEIAEAVKEEFGIDVSRQQVRHYNPEQSDEVAETWRELFRAEREKAIDDTSDIGIAHLAVRLRRMESMFHAALEMQNSRFAAELLEQAAKDSGGVFERSRDVSAGGAGAIPSNVEEAIGKVYGQPAPPAE